MKKREEEKAYVEETEQDDSVVLYVIISAILIAGAVFMILGLQAKNKQNPPKIASATRVERQQAASRNASGRNETVHTVQHVQQFQHPKRTQIALNNIDETKQAVIPQNQQIPFNRYKFNYVYTLNFKNDVTNVVFEVPLPSTESGKQYISYLKMSPQPSKIYFDGVNKYAEYNFAKKYKGKTTISLSGIADVRSYDLNTAKRLKKSFAKEKNVRKFIQPSYLIESDDKQIRKIAEKIPGKTQEEVVSNIYRFVQKSLKYKKTPRDFGARETLKYRYGKCTEFAALMVALCRARNIPARVICGNIARDVDVKHTWVEVYFDKYGWVLYDPTNDGSVINIYRNGKLSSVRSKVSDNKTFLRYIASGKDFFSPWSILYESETQDSVDISVDEGLNIAGAK